MTEILQTSKEHSEKDKFPSKLSLIEFWAPWCSSCKKLEPVLKNLEETFPDDLILTQINIDDKPELADQNNIYSIPTVIITSEGEEIDRIIGNFSQNVYIEKIKNILN